MKEIELMTYCPICGWGIKPSQTHRGFEKCSCCGFEYGITDLNPENSFTKWREDWISKGCKFRFPNDSMPNHWDFEFALKQLENIYKLNNLPHFVTLLNICPACGWDKLRDPPYNIYNEPTYEICPCCGFEYGVTDTDKGFTFDEWRERWKNNGFSFWTIARKSPAGWGVEMALNQLKNINKVNYKPRLPSRLVFKNLNKN